ALWRTLRTDPRAGASPGALRRALPGQPAEAAIGSAARFLVKAGYLRDQDGVLQALHPSELGVAPAPLRARALHPPAHRDRQQQRDIVDYADAPACRRCFILGYFGDEDAPKIDACDRCDVCERAAGPTLDGAARAQVLAVLAAAHRLGGRYGRTRLAQTLEDV